MTVQTRSSFLYGYTIDDTNLFIDFDENTGNGPVFLQLNVGAYSYGSLAIEVERALNDVGTLDYEVLIDRSERNFTINCIGGAPTYLFSTGDRAATSAHPVLGFSNVDVTGASVSSNFATGTIFKPQFFLQNYIDFEDFREANIASVNESASGIVEVVKYGERQFMQCNIRYQNNIIESKESPIEPNSQGVEELRLFMRFITTKSPLEFFPDRDLPTTFFDVILERLQGSSTGTGYRLRELYAQGLPGYYDTGNLVFRRIV